MKSLRKLCKICALVFVFSMITPSIQPLTNGTIAQASTVKMNKKQLTLVVGQTKTLQMIGTKKKGTWSSSNNAVVKVSTKGKASVVKVTAVKVGHAKITALVDKTKYTCSVTVKETENKNEMSNPYVDKAPFDAVATKAGKFNFVIPKNWTKQVISDTEDSIGIIYYPTSTDVTKEFSYISVAANKFGSAIDYETFKDYYKDVFTKESYESLLAQQGMDAKVTEFSKSDYQSTLGTALKIEYKTEYNEKSFTGVEYYLIIDNYLFEVNGIDIGDSTTPSVSNAEEYLLNTIQYTK